jgi:hypothetical protein
LTNSSGRVSGIPQQQVDGCQDAESTASMAKPKHRRKARSTVLQTAAAAAKERDQDTARLINQALEGGNVVGTAPEAAAATLGQTHDVAAESVCAVCVVVSHGAFVVHAHTE